MVAETAVGGVYIRRQLPATAERPSDQLSKKKKQSTLYLQGVSRLECRSERSSAPPLPF
jgi:hypothetical protein